MATYGEFGLYYLYFGHYLSAQDLDYLHQDDIESQGRTKTCFVVVEHASFSVLLFPQKMKYS